METNFTKINFPIAADRIVQPLFLNTFENNMLGVGLLFICKNRYHSNIPEKIRMPTGF
jgi:hypothetical protein